MDEVVGFRQNTDQNVRCSGCGVIVGKGSPYGTTIYKVVNGPVTGIFHSRECYERSVQNLSDNEDIKKEDYGQ